jgi:hypothetical protein
MNRRLTGLVALFATLVAGAASHHHPILTADSGLRPEEVITRHSPLSTASHLHAILKIIPAEACWACKWSRASGLPPSSRLSIPMVIVGIANVLPERSAASVARWTRRSRAPPDLF